jgi:PTH1 family peptidyl-tRNA hydrolase
MKLLVGLGNVGAEYATTRHNIGFMIVDELASRLGTTWKTEAKLRADVALADLAGERVILVKPATMMNLSGEAARAVANFYKVRPDDIWAAFDDVDVEFGRLRVRRGGSAGGHQGVRSLIAHLGEDFMRARLGISLNDRAVEPSETYVLKPFKPEERGQLPQVITRSADIILEQLGRDTPDETTFSVL